MSNAIRYDDLSDAQLELVHQTCNRFEKALRENKALSIESEIVLAPEEVRGPLFRELLAVEMEFRVTGENVLDIDEYLAHFPDRQDDIRQIFKDVVRRPAGRSESLHSRNGDSPMNVVGSEIGPYKLRQVLGEGGMGLVYVAEQEVPVRRKVALKIIKPGMDTREVIARFEAERQALALMDHPHIAQVFDAGTTKTGRPYFVMELIEGVPITDFCDSHKLTPRARLELFVQICLAMQYAHQKGFIHRDIKPTNILVTMRGDTPLPKVIDFGVAKAINDQRLTERTLHTQVSQLIGTPMYMSPEQADRSVAEVDTRTDVYSLGVVLYELLTGTTPFTKDRLSKVGYDEIRRIIREEDPPRPSQHFSTLDDKTQSTVCDRRAAGQMKLMQIIHGELDWIVMKALDKDIARRYESAGALAGDIQRYLADEPVLACPPSAGYRLRKFARRNKVAFAMATLVGVALLAAISGLVVSNIMITRQKNFAETQRERADENFRLARQSVGRYYKTVNHDLLLNRPEMEPLRNHLIDNAVEFHETLLERLRSDPQGDDPEVSVAVANTHIRLAQIHQRTPNMDQALSELEKAFDLVEELLTRLPADAREFRKLPGEYQDVSMGFYQDHFVHAHYWIRTRDMDRQRAVFGRGISLWQQFADAHPDVAAFRRELASFLLSAEGGFLGNQTEHLETFESVRSLQEELVEQNPHNREMLAELRTQSGT